ncbi:MAG TPA: hypothetical protein VL175_09690 [Pirellulales bacterium]|jgi:hypothetical protein|nr:hypothetical protein [Pirellulales bacterium]
MTNDDLLQAQLEQATAPGREPAYGCDAETRRLRETWIALGNLLETTSAGDLGPAQVVRQKASQQSKRFSSVTWAVAASVLCMAALAAWFGWNREQSSVQSAPAIAGTSEKQQPSNESEATLAIDSEATAWDDSLDGELLSLSQAASSLDSSWRTRSNRLTAVGDALDEIEQEIQQGTF